MSEEYRHIKDCEKEIEELKKEGYLSRKIGIKFGFNSTSISFALSDKLAIVASTTPRYPDSRRRGLCIYTDCR